ncbi:fumarylacetoacetate hydrolase [Colletotrichum incanum]|uniref:Fumarylacetoacetate hydrolase n=1 Tax=Colletotrichum incanum TaxID=1573173 RepID=A0A161WEH2_COLIC|nr:fumarylacetoacetate hydrolase [Colletotrichum incanum]
MEPASAGQKLTDEPPSYDRHLADFGSNASSSFSPSDPWRPTTVNLPLPGPGNTLERVSSAPTRDVKEQPSSEETPPEYTRQDPNDNYYALQAPLVLSAATATGALVPRYHLSQLRSSTNQPYKLSMRRLTTNESRRLSLPDRRPKKVDYDDDLTLYLIVNTHALFPWSLPEIEIRGCKARTLQGHVELKKTTTAHQFWHITRNVTNDMLRPENERRLAKYGYHADEELSRELLFVAESVALLSKNKRWKDGDGVCVAEETAGTLSLVVDLTPQRKDALLACWAARCWLSGSLNW